MKPGDVVIRDIPPGMPAPLRKGHHYWCLDVGEKGVISEVHETFVLIEGFGGWTFHKATLRIIKRGTHD